MHAIVRILTSGRLLRRVANAHYARVNLNYLSRTRVIRCIAECSGDEQGTAGSNRVHSFDKSKASTGNHPYFMYPGPGSRPISVPKKTTHFLLIAKAIHTR